jgi:Shedu protein SduA, C-terminal
MARPYEMHIWLASDGVVIVHQEAEELRAILHTEPRGTLDESLPHIAGGFWQPPFPPGEQVVLVGAGLRAVEVGTGRVLGESSMARFEVVGDRDLWHWDPRWAPTLARADFESAARGLLSGLVVPFASSAVQALHASADQLEALLADDPPEERLQEFLKEFPRILAPTHSQILAKPKLGSDHVPDFAFEDNEAQWTLVEIEASKHSVFTRAGNPTAALTHAVRRVSDWRDWVAEHRAYARNTLPRVRDIRGLVVIGRGDSEELLTSLRRYEATLNGVRVMTWDELVSSARRQAHNLQSVVTDATVSDGALGEGDAPQTDS